MESLIQVILPVFLVIGFGYGARAMGWFRDEWVDGLMRFTQSFALPCLLFNAISKLDLGQSFEMPLLASFYAGAIAGFVLGLSGARWVFRRAWPDSVAIGFCAMFSNTLLLGVPIMERAYGPASLTANYAIVAVHAPFCYVIGITMMEAVRNRGASMLHTLANIAGSLTRNGLVIGIVLGFLSNLSGTALPSALDEAVAMMVRAALPAALFGLGGILFRYRPEGDMRAILFVCAISLVLHPALTLGLGKLLGLTTAQLRSAVVTAAMAPGVNAYVFANLYGVAKRVAASAVLIGTLLSILTVWAWLAVLP